MPSEFTKKLIRKKTNKKNVFLHAHYKTKLFSFKFWCHFGSWGVKLSTWKPPPLKVLNCKRQKQATRSFAFARIDSVASKA